MFAKAFWALWFVVCIYGFLQITWKHWTMYSAQKTSYYNEFITEEEQEFPTLGIDPLGQPKVKGR